MRTSSPRNHVRDPVTHGALPRALAVHFARDPVRLPRGKFETAGERRAARHRQPQPAIAATRGRRSGAPADGARSSPARRGRQCVSWRTRGVFAGSRPRQSDLHGAMVTPKRARQAGRIMGRWLITPSRTRAAIRPDGRRVRLGRRHGRRRRRRTRSAGRRSRPTSRRSCSRTARPAIGRARPRRSRCCRTTTCAPRAPEIVKATESRRMPPWLATQGPGFPALLDDRRLTDRQITAIEDLGRPTACRPATCAARRRRHRFRRRGRSACPTSRSTLPRTIAIPAGGSDEYRNVVIPVWLSR